LIWEKILPANLLGEQFCHIPLNMGLSNKILIEKALLSALILYLNYLIMHSPLILYC